MPHSGPNPKGSKYLIIIYLPKICTISTINIPKPKYLTIGYLDPLGKP